MSYDPNGPWIRVVSADSLFTGVTPDKVLDMAQNICDRPHRYAKSTVPAVYRALVRLGVCTEAEAVVGVSEVLKLRKKLLRKEVTA